MHEKKLPGDERRLKYHKKRPNPLLNDWASMNGGTTEFLGVSAATRTGVRRLAGRTHVSSS